MVSIIIPCYNCEAFISRAIESVLEQTMSDWELLLINNNSTDNTQKVLDRYTLKYPAKIRNYCELKPGAPAARNKGLNLAQGEWIQFLDADDKLLPEKLERQLRIADSLHSDIVVGSYYLHKTINNKETEMLKSPRVANVWESLITSKLGITSANLWRRKVVIAARGWDEELSSSQEYDLLFRMMKQKAVISFDLTPSSIIYSQENSISNTVNTRRLEQILDDRLDLRIEIRNYLKNEGLLTPHITKLWDLYLYHLLMKRKTIIPKYVSRRLRELGLKVPLKVRVKLNTKYYLKSILG